MIKVHRYIADGDSPPLSASISRCSFVKGEHYHVSRLIYPDNRVDETHVVVMGLFKLSSGVTKEIKPIILKTDCKKYLIHKP